MCVTVLIGLIGPITALQAPAQSALAASSGSRAATPFARGVLMNVIVSKPSAIKGGDWDDKTQRLVVRLKFTNQDIHETYEGYTATISVLGQSTIDGKVKKVLLQDAVKLSLTPRQVQEHMCKEVTTKYDKTGVKFGYFYDGWIVVIKDAAGKVVQVKSTVPNYEKLPEPASLLADSKCYNGKLQPVGEPNR